MYFLKALQEISVEERKRTLENNKMEVQTVKKKLEVLNADIKIDDKRVQESMKKVFSILFYFFFVDSLSLILIVEYIKKMFIMFFQKISLKI